MKQVMNYQGKTAVFSIIYGVLLFAFVAQSAQARDRQIKTIGDTSIELITPAGQCLMDPSFPADAGFISTVAGVLARSHNVLSAFADCAEQKVWRTGKRKYLDSFGQIITPLAMLRMKVPVSRRKFVAQVCEQMKKMREIQKKKIMAIVKKRMESHVEGAKFGEMKFLAGGKSDATICYFPSQQKITTPDGTVRTIAGVSAITLVKGKMVQINLYDLLKDAQTFIDLFAQQKENITRLLALPGNK